MRWLTLLKLEQISKISKWMLFVYYQLLVCFFELMKQLFSLLAIVWSLGWQGRRQLRTAYSWLAFRVFESVKSRFCSTKTASANSEYSSAKFKTVTFPHIYEWRWSTWGAFVVVYKKIISWKNINFFNFQVMRK